MVSSLLDAMAPFSKRQIGYIKAVAGVGQHKSFIKYDNIACPAAAVDTTKDPAGEYTEQNKLTSQPPTQLAAIVDDDNLDITFKRLGGALFALNNIPLTCDHTDSSADINDHFFMQSKFEKALKPHKMQLLCQSTGAESTEPLEAQTYFRVGEDFYLESTHVRWRFTMPDFTVPAGKQPHYEFRWIVFRQRKPTLQRGENPTGDHKQWLNFNYDLFSGYEGRRVGWSGHRYHEQFDGDERYINEPVTTFVSQEYKQSKLTADDLMTMPLNDADYVIMRDERFFLGAEHGKSHYETTTRFDWSDPGSCSSYNLIEGLDDSKNYDWFFLILGTSNDAQQPNLNISCRATTALASA